MARGEPYLQAENHSGGERGALAQETQEASLRAGSRPLVRQEAIQGDADDEPPDCFATIVSRKKALLPAPYGIAQRRFSSIGGGLLLDAITEEPLGIDRVEAQPMLEFLAQLADVALDDVLVDVFVEEPVDGVEDLRLADAPAATA